MIQNFSKQLFKINNNNLKLFNFKNQFKYNKILNSKGIYLQPEQKSLVDLDFNQIEDNLVVKSIFKHYADEIKIKELPKQNYGTNTNPIENSFQQITIPLTTNQDIREHLIRFDQKSIRTGRLMEIFDLLAGLISYNYCGNAMKEATIVTACVDNIRFFQDINLERDLVIQGYPSFVGNSSIEIACDLYQKSRENGLLTLKAKSAFLMVARCSKDRSKAYKLPKFQPSSKVSEQLQEQGLKRQKQRIDNSKNSLYIKSPQQNQIDEIHKFFTHRSEYENNEQKYQEIEKTLLTKIQPMHFQDRNIHGNIFGGYIIREAFELGYLNAMMHSGGEMVKTKYINDFQFIKPVNIGDILKFESRLAYSYENYAFILVECFRVGFDNKIIEKTNELDLVFELSKPGKEVFPISYQNGMRYLQGQKYMHFHQIKK